MAMEGIYNVPDFHYQPRVERSGEQKRDRRNQREEQKKKKKKDDGAGSLFESLADSLSQYGDEPFQFNGQDILTPYFKVFD